MQQSKLHPETPGATQELANLTSLVPTWHGAPSQVNHIAKKVHNIMNNIDMIVNNINDILNNIRDQISRDFSIFGMTIFMNNKN